MMSLSIVHSMDGLRRMLSGIPVGIQLNRAWYCIDTFTIMGGQGSKRPVQPFRYNKSRVFNAWCELQD